MQEEATNCPSPSDPAQLSCAFCRKAMERSEHYVQPLAGRQEPRHRRCMPEAFWVNAYWVERVHSGRGTPGGLVDDLRPLASVPLPYEFDGTPEERASRMRRSFEEEGARLTALIGSVHFSHAGIGPGRFEVRYEEDPAYVPLESDGE